MAFSLPFLTNDKFYATSCRPTRKRSTGEIPPFLSEDIHFIVDGVVATGAAAFHPGQSPPTSPSSTDSSSPLQNETPSPAPVATQESRSGLLYDADAEEIMAVCDISSSLSLFSL